MNQYEITYLFYPHVRCHDLILKILEQKKECYKYVQNYSSFLAGMKNIHSYVCDEVFVFLF